MSISPVSFLVFLFLVGSVNGAVIYVPDDYPTIQGAIDAAASADTIVVRAGTYGENIDFAGKDVALVSESGPSVTTIDGNSLGSTVTFANGEGPGAMILGFTITNGFTTTYLVGGGIQCSASSPTIRNNWIIGNHSDYEGGGILCIHTGTALIMNNLIEDNWAHDGAGVTCMWGGDATIVGNDISLNTGDNAAGIHCNGASPLIERNRIYGNDSQVFNGGGINLGDSSPLIVNNLIHSNLASWFGGGIYADYGSVPTITNNTIYDNYADQGGGIYCRGNTAAIPVANTILWDNYAPTGPEIHVGTPAEPSDLTVDFSDLSGGQASCYVESGSTLVWGANNIDADPLFADAGGDDFHITFNSPCRDTGANGAAGVPAADFESDPRVVQTTIDIGADEFYYHLYTMGRIIPGNNITIKVVGLPGFGVRLATHDTLKDPPLQTQHGLLHLETPFLGDWPLGNVPGDGVFVFPTAVPASWVPGERWHFQALVGQWGYAYTRITNRMTLRAE